MPQFIDNLPTTEPTLDELIRIEIEEDLDVYPHLMGDDYVNAVLADLHNY